MAGPEILDAMDLLKSAEEGLNDLGRFKAAALQKGNHLFAAVECPFPVEEILLLPSIDVGIAGKPFIVCVEVDVKSSVLAICQSK